LLKLKFGDQFLARTRQEKDSISLNAPLVFVGYGIVAPEYAWNDFKDVDVRNKIVISLIGTPHVGTKDLMGAMSSTYYGRRLYKYQEAARHGAKGALIIHNPAAADFSWQSLIKEASGKVFDINDPEQ